MSEKGRGCSEFEEELKRVMGRVVPPPELLQKVLNAPAERRGSTRVLGFPARQAWAGWVAASLVLAGLLAGGVQHRRAAERAQAERDFGRAMEITDRTMEHTMRQLQHAGLVLD